MTRETLVRWKVHGIFIKDGMGQDRSPGDEDMMDVGRAKANATCGMVEILGKSDKVPNKRPQIFITEVEEESGDEHSVVIHG